MLKQIKTPSGTVWLNNMNWEGSVYPDEGGYRAIARTAPLAKEEKVFLSREDAERFVEKKMRR